MDIKKVVLAYSGGLDTSVILRWLKEKYNCEILFYINKKISHIFQNCPCKIINNLDQINKIDFYQYLLTFS